MSNQVKLSAEPRPNHGKGASGRLRRAGKVPGILYGYQVEPTAVAVDALELYHSQRTEAGANALIRLELEGETYLTVTRDLHRHPVKGHALHVDFIAVDRDTPISVDVPVHLVDEDELADAAGVVSLILHSVSVLVKPLDVPNHLELSLAGLHIGDVKRVEDLRDALPAGAEFAVDLDETVVTVNAPISDAELEALEESAGIETPEPAPAEDAASDDAADEA